MPKHTNGQPIILGCPLLIQKGDQLEPKLAENPMIKFLRSDDYNFNFNKTTGFFMRWGKTFEDNPTHSVFGPELVDIEISTVCNGVPGAGPCKFCYKSNTGKGENMTLNQFKDLFSNLPKTVMQIAFGIGDLDGNPDMRSIFEYTREKGVIPNVTINGAGLTDEWAEWLAKTCGAVAVSYYDGDLTDRAVRLLKAKGLDQVNIHHMLAAETLDAAYDIIERYKNGLPFNAVVFLGLKQKGRATKGFSPVPEEEFKKLVDVAIQQKVPIGFDSCSAFKFLRNVNNPEQYEQSVEPCESTLFSSYFNVEGKFFPCSFIEGTTGWENGIDAKGFWDHQRTVEFRNKVIQAHKNCRSCVYYEI